MDPKMAIAKALRLARRRYAEGGAVRPRSGTIFDDAGLFAGVGAYEDRPEQELVEAPPVKKPYRQLVSANWTTDEEGNRVPDLSKNYFYRDVDPYAGVEADQGASDNTFGPVRWGMRQLPESVQSALALPGLVAAMPELITEAGVAEYNQMADDIDQRAAAYQPRSTPGPRGIGRPANIERGRPNVAAEKAAAALIAAPVGLAKGIYHAGKHGIETGANVLTGQPVDSQDASMGAFDFASILPAAAAGAGFVSAETGSAVGSAGGNLRGRGRGRAAQKAAETGQSESPLKRFYRGDFRGGSAGRMGATRGEDIAMFYPEDIRSRFAQFDPQKTDSADLLASNPDDLKAAATAAVTNQEAIRRGLEMAERDSGPGGTTIRNENYRPMDEVRKVALGMPRLAVGKAADLFKSRPVQDIPIDQIRPGQSQTQFTREGAETAFLNDEPAILLKHGDGYIALDGNHRIMRDRLRGEGTTRALVYSNPEEAKAAMAALTAGRELQRGFYSPSLEAAKKLPQERGTVEQMRAMLLDPKRGGKQKELDAVGFDRAFPDPAVMVTKGDIEAFLRDSRLQLGSERYGSHHFDNLDSVAQQKYGRDFSDLEHAEQQVIYREMPQARYESYSTPGGRDYRETVTTLPFTKGKAEYIEQARQMHPEASDTMLEKMWHEYATGSSTVGLEKQAYTSSHWPGVTNPLLHRRSKVFDNPDGSETVLLDEAAQSDWAQRARDQGMKDPTAIEGLRAEHAAAVDARVKTHAEFKAALKADESGPRVDALQTAHDEARNRVMDLKNKIRAAESGVPSAPYISNTSDWVDLAIKQSLIETANRPKATVMAWAPGEVQVNRYPSLREAGVDEISIAKPKDRDDGTRLVNLYMRGDGGTNSFYVDQAGIIRGHGAGRIAREIKDGTPLSDVIGREQARRLLASEDGIFDFDAPHIRNAEGIGMGKFYGDWNGDKYEPGIYGLRLLKLVKAIDPEAARIEPARIETSPFERRTPNEKWQEFKYPSITMTPKLREAILRDGFGLFSNKEDAALTVAAAAAQRAEMWDYALSSNPDEPLFAATAAASGQKDIAKELPARKLSPIGTYSKLGETIDQAERKQGNAQAWLNLFKDAGVKKEELYWTGMDDWLKEKGNAKISKDEVAQAFKEREVKVYRHLHDDEGHDPSIIIDDERESYARGLVEDYEVRRIEPSEADIQAQIEALHIVREPEGTFKVTEFPEGTKGPAHEYDIPTMEEAEAARAEIARKVLDDAPQYGIFDGSGELIEGEFSSERSARNEIGDIANRTAAEVMREADVTPIQRTSGFLKDRPGDGSDFTENVVRINEDTLKRKGSKGFEAAGIDDVHPDSLYDHSPGWTLEENYGDALGRGSGSVLHEVQSRWGQSGSELGFKKEISPEALKQLKDRAAEAMDRTGDLRHRFVEDDTSHDGGLGVFRIDPTANFVERRNLTNFVTGRLREMANLRRKAADAEHVINRLSSGIEAARIGLREGPSPELTERIRLYEEMIGTLNRDKKSYEDLIRGFENDLATEYPPDKIERIDHNRDPERVKFLSDEFAAWRKAFDVARLRENEATAALKAAEEGGVEPGPFVMSTGDFTNLLAKNALHRAAKGRKNWVGWSGPSRMSDRWGDHLADYYGRTVPDTILKLVRQHDPKAKIETFYPGEELNPIGNYSEINSYNRAQLDAIASRGGAGTLDHQFSFDLDYKTPSVSVNSRKPIVGIILDKDGRYRLTTDEPGKGNYTDYAKDSQGGVMQFRSRAAAEKAMEDINRTLEEDRASLADPEAAKTRWHEDSDQMEPYRGVLLSDEARQGILKRGFPLFVNRGRLPVFLPPEGLEDDVAEQALRYAKARETKN